MYSQLNKRLNELNNFNSKIIIKKSKRKILFKSLFNNIIMIMRKRKYNNNKKKIFKLIFIKNYLKKRN